MILYIYSKDSGIYLYRDNGNVDGALYDMGDDKDFTLTSPPDYDQPWYWVDSKWTTEPAN